MVHVDYRSTCVYLGLVGSSIEDFAGSAWQGFCMHACWVAAAVLIHEFFPHRLHEVAAVSLTAMVVGVDDYISHFLYVVFRLWRSPAGRACLWLPRVSDADVNLMAQYAFFLAFTAVTLGGIVLEVTSPTSPRNVAFYLLMVVSTAPGAWCFLSPWGAGLEAGNTSVRYYGRKRGRGYEHREAEASYRPLGSSVCTAPSPLARHSPGRDGSVFSG